jgi:hypothetical protein
MAGGQPIAERVRRVRHCLRRARPPSPGLLGRDRFEELLQLERRRSRPFSVPGGSIGEIDASLASGRARSSHST